MLTMKNQEIFVGRDSIIDPVGDLHLHLTTFRISCFWCNEIANNFHDFHADLYRHKSNKNKKHMRVIGCGCACVVCDALPKHMSDDGRHSVYLRKVSEDLVGEMETFVFPCLSKLLMHELITRVRDFECNWCDESWWVCTRNGWQLVHLRVTRFACLCVCFKSAPNSNARKMHGHKHQFPTPFVETTRRKNCSHSWRISGHHSTERWRTALLSGSCFPAHLKVVNCCHVMHVRNSWCPNVRTCESMSMERP